MKLYLKEHENEKSNREDQERIDDQVQRNETQQNPQQEVEITEKSEAPQKKTTEKQENEIGIDTRAGRQIKKILTFSVLTVSYNLLYSISFRIVTEMESMYFCS